MSVFLYFEMLESVIFIGIIKIRYKVSIKIQGAINSTSHLITKIFIFA